MPSFFAKTDKRIFIFIFLLLLGFLVVLAIIVKPKTSAPFTTSQAPTISSATAPKETLQVAQGSASVKRADQAQTVQQDQTLELVDADTITTSANTIATIHYDKETLVRIAPNSTVIFHSIKDQTSSIENQAGSIYVRFKKLLGVRESFEAETPTAVATVRGTGFALWYRLDRSSRVSVTHDTVLVTKKDDLGNLLPDSEIPVPENNKADVKTATGTAVLLTKILPSDEESGWINFNIQADKLWEEYINSLCPTCDIQTTDANLFATLAGQLTPRLFATPTPTRVPTPTRPPTPVIQSMPGDGYSRSLVKTDTGDHLLSCIGANKNNIRVITDAGNDNDCKNDCPVMPLAEYAKKNGGYAAMNGMYFCPADYPACSDKKNSFDTLFFISRLKKYLNSDNNVYSVLPFLAIESNGNPLFKSKTLDWGRDTGIQAGTAGHPMLVQGGSVVATEAGLDEKQKTVKANRGAIAQKGDMLYMCITGNATVLDSAKVYGALKADNAINIDGGGSSAMWLNGSYLYGPGRNIPTAIIFARR